MQDVFGAKYVSLHVRVTNQGAHHLYTQSLGYQCAPLPLQLLPEYRWLGPFCTAWGNALPMHMLSRRPASSCSHEEVMLTHPAQGE